MLGPVTPQDPGPPGSRSLRDYGAGGLEEAHSLVLELQEQLTKRVTRQRTE